MKMRSVVPMRIAKYGYIGLSAFFCVLGSLFILRPEASADFLSELLGAGLAVFGIVKIVGYYSKDLYRLAFQYDLEFGILMLILGIVALVYPSEARSFLMIATGIVALIDSLFKLRIARDARAFGIKQWGLVHIVAVVTAITGICLMLHPWQSSDVLNAALGLALITQGILNISVVISMVKISKNQYPDVIDAEYEVYK